ncbi:MAG TPA: hypothetical protein PLV21_02300 [Cyclobacteriaceae bacterium]|nr:hypothetical protein [Cyclobacteriaceae bacterium]HRJ80688.1 hypothetical protein [Cyclobacteriaceae bacterium]
MTELVITSREDLEKILRNFVDEFFNSRTVHGNVDSEERLNQKEAAEYLGITQGTLIRWKYKGLVPVEQLPGSNKVTYYKSQLKAVIQRNPKLLQPTRK